MYHLQKSFLIQKLYYSSLQFFHDIKFLGEDMKAFLSVLNSQEMRAPVQTREPEVIIRHIRVSIVKKCTPLNLNNCVMSPK